MKQKGSKGFTLVELLVATAVTAIIVGLMISMVSNLLTAYNRSSGALSAQSQSSLVFDQLASELESMVVRNSDEVMFAATIGSGMPGGYSWNDSQKPAADSLLIPDAPAVPADPAAPAPELDPIEELRFGVGGVWLRMITSAPTLAGDPNSGVRAVGYRLELAGVTSAPGAPVQYMLYRTEISAQDTFDNGYELDPDSGDYNYGGTLLENPGSGQIIAGNVVDFGVRLYTFNEDGRRDLVYPRGDGAADLEYLPSGSGGDPYPQAAEIMIRTLTPEGVRLIDAKRANPSAVPQSWWEIVIQNSEVFSRVINIPSRPL